MTPDSDLLFIVYKHVCNLKQKKGQVINYEL